MKKEEKLGYSDIKFNPPKKSFAYMRQIMLNNGTLVGNSIDLLVDTHEPPEIANAFKKLGYNVKYQTLEVADYLFEGGIAFERKSSDFTNFADVITKAREIKETFPKSYLIVDKDIKQLIMSKRMYGKTPFDVVDNQFAGLIARLSIEGMHPIFCHSQEFMVNVMDRIVRKELDLDDFDTVGKIAGFRIATSEDYTMALYVNIPGIGGKFALKILEKYPSMDKLMKASIEELTEIEGIGTGRATKIYNSLRGKAIE
jgi:ERCC4-type nuclease